jgi:hypothetical protein
MDPQEFQNRVEQFQKMSPQQQQAALQQFQNMDPQQRQAAMQQFQNLNPQLQRNVMQQIQNVDPQQQQSQNMDPQQMLNMFQQRIDSSLREQMGVTNDSEWSLIEVKINAVTKARIALMPYGGGMTGMGGMRGGGRGFQSLFSQPSLESKALQQAIDSGAPTAQTQNLLIKFRAAREEKQVALVKAQDDLRSVLTMRQQAIVTLGGLLD